MRWLRLSLCPSQKCCHDAVRSEEEAIDSVPGFSAATASALLQGEYRAVAVTQLSFLSSSTHIYKQLSAWFPDGRCAESLSELGYTFHLYNATDMEGNRWTISMQSFAR